jgi:hypothetical protein
VGKAGTTNVILRYKTEKPKGKSQIFKKFQTGLGVFSSKGGVIQSADTVIKEKVFRSFCAPEKKGEKYDDIS